jgi:hypothetical protein
MPVIEQASGCHPERAVLPTAEHPAAWGVVEVVARLREVTTVSTPVVVIRK